MSGALALLLLVLGCASLAPAASDHRHLRSILTAFFDAGAPASAPVQAACAGCARRYQTLLDDDAEPPREEDEKVDSVTAQELTALRIEHIKNQILAKLKLKRRPSSTVQLPPPVEADVLHPRRPSPDVGDAPYRHYADDFYGRTIQAIIFPYEDEAKCVRKIRHPSACVPFRMPADVAASDVSRVELWFFKAPDAADTHNQTFVVSEVAHWDTSKSFQKNKPIAILETHLTEGWIKVDVTSVIKNWLMYQDSPTHAIAVACKTCAMDMSRSPISFRATFKPFLMIRTFAPQAPAPVVRRPKRSIKNCQPGGAECCRESLYVSFAEMDWSDWIIEPKGFSAYFCKGACNTTAALSRMPSNYNNVLKTVMFGGNRTRPERIELKPCCAPTKWNSLEILYVSDNKTILKSSIPHMKVEACGCT